MTKPPLAIRLFIYLLIIAVGLWLGGLSHQSYWQRKMEQVRKRHPATRAATLVGMAGDPLAAIMVGYETYEPAVKIWRPPNKQQK